MFQDFIANLDREIVKSGKWEAPEQAQPDVIPDGTKLPVMIEKIEWMQSYENEAQLNIMWRVVDGPHNNRVLFQKLLLQGETKFVTGEKAEKKRVKDGNAFAVICVLAKATHLLRGNDWPTDGDLAASLAERRFTITAKVWKMKGDDGQDRTGNWIAGVAEYAPAPVATGAPMGKKELAKAAAAAGNFDDEIPF